MAVKRTLEQRISELREKQELNKAEGKKLKEEERRLKARLSAENRKKHNSHMIQIGDLVYTILGRDYQEGDIERLSAFLNSLERGGKIFSEAMNVKQDNAKADLPDSQIPKTGKRHFNNVDDVLNDISKAKH